MREDIGFGLLLSYIPTAISLLLGWIIPLVYYRTHRRPARFALIAISILTLTFVFDILQAVGLINAAIVAPVFNEQVYDFLVTGGVLRLLDGVAIVLLVIAVFVARPRQDAQ